MVVVNLYAFEKTAAQARRRLRAISSKTSTSAVPPWSAPPPRTFEDVAIVTSRRRLPRPRIEELEAATRRALAAKPAGARQARPSPPPPPTTPPSPTPSTRSLDDATSSDIAPARAGLSRFPNTLRINFRIAQSLRYGENPHQRAALYSDGTGLGVASGQPAARQRTQLQQPRRSRRLLGAGQEFDRACRRHHQAHQPLRRGHRRHRPRGLSAGPRVRSGLRLRRRHRHQPRRRRRSRRRNRQALRRSHRRPGLHPRSPRPLRRQEEPPPGRNRPTPPAPGRSNTSPAACSCRTPTSVRVTEAELKVVTRRPPTAEEMRSPALRLAASASTSNPTPSSTPATARPSASAPAR